MDQMPSPGEAARTILSVGTTTWVDRADAPDPAPHAVSLSDVVLCPDPPAVGVPALAVGLEVADAAPLAVRERIRGRVRIVGRAVALPGCGALHVHPSSITLLRDDRTFLVDVRDLLAAEADPVGQVEAAVLGHLDAHHGDVLALLTRLVPPRHLQGVVRVWPYRVDRHGLVLRLEYATGHRDQRLPFATALTGVDDLSREMSLLIEQANGHRPGCARHLRGTLASVLRAGPAAGKICSADEPGA